jgi:hypothetical protein
MAEKGLKHRLIGKIREADMFGHPISLKYKKSIFFQSSFGGIISLIVIIGLLTYFMNMFLQTVTH